MKHRNDRHSSGSRIQPKGDGQMTIYYPVVTKPKRHCQPRLSRVGKQLLELRRMGWTISQLRLWVDEQIGWLPSERTVYYFLSTRKIKK